ncbi:MAG TPA: DNA replication and repair protein RecF [Opitutae bacterium]|nr:DNA replication and repair protein RecF [Opitutaceae bacterium]HCR30281.1 DNA replication and repair protein RecF [Opitutae bacterium]
MNFKRVSLVNYRNIRRARIDLDSRRIFFHGANGQGKTNLLEALGMVTALRAFRTHENRVMIGPDGEFGEARFDIECERSGESIVDLRIKKSGKEVKVDSEPVKRLSDFAGRYPTVVLSSNDLQLTRGSPGGRRRFIDTFICGIDRGYFAALQKYQKLLQERNALLRSEENEGVVTAFEKQMDIPAVTIGRARKDIIGELLKIASPIYKALSSDSEEMGIEYTTSAAVQNEGEFLEILEKNRKRDRYLQSTSQGPHRDDYALFVNRLPASDYASEGQQRSITLALSLAIIQYWRDNMGLLPVVLADDAFAELDSHRRERFWELLSDDMQLVATGTQLPEICRGDDWQTVVVADGVFSG